MHVPGFVADLSGPKSQHARLKRLEAARSLMNRFTARQRSKQAVASIEPIIKLPTDPMVLVWRDPTVQRVSVRGTFSDPPWMEDILCVRDPRDGLFKTDLRSQSLGPGTYLYKFIVDGIWKADIRQPQRLDRDGVANNFIFLRSSVRPLKTVQSVPHALYDLRGHGSLVRQRTVDGDLQDHETSRSSGVACYKEAARGGPFALWSSAWMIPHAGNDTSADAFFYTTVGVGVSDSVGEWESRFKLNPTQFSEDLMEGCRQRAQAICRNSVDSSGDAARSGLAAAFADASHFGSATACVGFLNSEKDSMSIVNLGDSSFAHFRKDEVFKALTCITKSREQQHTFNMPYQLTNIPSVGQYDALSGEGEYKLLIEALMAARKTPGQLHITDTVESADHYCCQLEEGDLFLYMTDGVLDNLWLVQVTGLLSSFVSPRDAKMLGSGKGTSPADIARCIAEAAFDVSQNRDSTLSQTPFAYNSRRQGFRNFHSGGKPDDITVVACWVVRPEDIPVAVADLTSKDWILSDNFNKTPRYVMLCAFTQYDTL